MQAEQLHAVSGQVVEGPLLLTPRILSDERGFFLESWNERAFAKALELPQNQSPVFHQDNHSHSIRGVLRGLHYQLEPEPQGKLVRCPRGEVFDVAVDIRRNSETFGQWVGALLSSDNHCQLWIPVGFAHGFLTISDKADVMYKASGFWSKDCERSLLWNDPDLAIAWPLDRLEQSGPLLATKDATAQTLVEAVAVGDVFS
jgi:dTDP-4-dehydrorhamnose 3,5-epimerase